MYLKAIIGNFRGEKVIKSFENFDTSLKQNPDEK